MNLYESIKNNSGKSKKLNESRKTQDFINDLSADQLAMKVAGIPSGSDSMTFEQYNKYQDALHEIKKNDTSKYEITISYWDRNGYPKEKTFVGRNVKTIAKKLMNAKDNYDFRELSDYSDNLYELADNSECYGDVEEYLDMVARGEVPKILDEAEGKKYNLIHADSNKISELEKGSAITWEGLNKDDDSLSQAVDFFTTESKGFKVPCDIYWWSGKEFNDKYGLTGDNRYPDDLNFISIPLDMWSEMGNLPMLKFQVGARWLDDIVDNNARREGREDLNEAEEFSDDLLTYSIDQINKVLSEIKEAGIADQHLYNAIDLLFALELKLKMKMKGFE